MKTGETVKSLHYRYNVGRIMKYFNIFIISVISFFVRNMNLIELIMDTFRKLIDITYANTVLEI